MSLVARNLIRLSLVHAGSTYLEQSLDDLAAAGLPGDVVLKAVQDRLGAAVDAEAERLRNRVATPGAGQAMEYQEAQAQAFAALQNPGAATSAAYPMLAATIGLDKDPSTGAPATDVLGVARAVQAAYAAWLQAGSAIRRIRLTGKAAIGDAASLDAAFAAFDAIVWPAFD